MSTFPSLVDLFVTPIKNNYKSSLLLAGLYSAYFYGLSEDLFSSANLFGLLFTTRAFTSNSFLRWKSSLRKKGYTGKVPYSFDRLNSKILLTSVFAASTYMLHPGAIELLKDPFASKENLTLFSGVLPLLYTTNSFFPQIVNSSFIKRLFSLESYLLDADKQFLSKDHSIVSNIVGVKKSKQSQFFIDAILEPKQLDASDASSYRFNHMLFENKFPLLESLISSQYPVAEMEFLRDYNYEVAKKTVSSLDEQVYLALLAHKFDKPEAPSLWEDLIKQSTVSGKYLRRLSLSSQNFLLFERTHDSKKSIDDLFEIEQVVSSELKYNSELFSPFTVFRDEAHNSFFQLFYDAPTFRQYLLTAPVVKQKELFSNYFSHMQTLDGVLSKTSLAHEKIIDLENKHLNNPASTSRHYISALADAIAVIQPSHKSHAQILMDYHAENMLYDPRAQRFITIDHEPKGKGHPYFDVVNSLEFLCGELSLKSFADRLPFIEQRNKQINYVPNSVMLEYACVDFLRQDAFMKAWSNPTHPRYADRIMYLNRGIDLYAELESKLDGSARDIVHAQLLATYELKAKILG